MTTPLTPAQPSVLLVDDDPYMLGLQARMLRSMGYATVGMATSARDALATLRQPGQVDVIVCDLNMPGMDGIEFLQALNGSDFVGGVILLSGECPRILHTVQKLLNGGRLTILGALGKPAQPDALRALLDCWAQQPDTAPQEVKPVTPTEVQLAISKQQWVLHYQPKVSLITGALIGVEALVRWDHPVHGLVYPDAFIGLAEEGGLIDALTYWVLNEAVRQLATWQREGLKIQIAVNVSMDNLRAPAFAHMVSAIARDAGVLPQDVTLEITESRAMSPSPAPLESLVRLRLQRFKLSIDDFGTGHSSLAQLRDVPFTELKIDQGFVHGARHNQIIRPMLDGSIGMAKRMGMVSVAEGVETEDDWQLMRELDCDVAQGYFIGHPMTASELPPWQLAWETRRPGLVER